MVNDEWNSTQVLTRDQLFATDEYHWPFYGPAKLSVIKGDYDIILYDKGQGSEESFIFRILIFI